nr:MAG TPA: hypothetical protein [Caudoviricetes sp.]
MLGCCSLHVSNGVAGVDEHADHLAYGWLVGRLRHARMLLTSCLQWRRGSR